MAIHVTSTVREILQFAAEGRVWPTGELARKLVETSPDKTAELSEEDGIDNSVEVDSRGERRGPTEPPLRDLKGDDLSVLLKLGSAEALHLDESLEIGAEITLRRVRIVGKVDASSAGMPKSFAAFDCSFDSDVDFRDSRLKLLCLRNCRLRGMSLHRTTVELSLLLDRSVFYGKLDISNAEIGDALSAEEAVFGAELTRGDAVDAQYVSVRSYASFRDARFYGALDAYRAKVGGYLSLDGGIFDTLGEKVPVHLKLASIDTYLSLENIELAGGRMDLSYVEVGDLYCTGIGSLSKSNRKREENAPLNSPIEVILYKAIVRDELRMLEVSDVRKIVLNKVTVGEYNDDETSWPKLTHSFMRRILARMLGRALVAKSVEILSLDGFEYGRLENKNLQEWRDRRKWLDSAQLSAGDAGPREFGRGPWITLARYYKNVAQDTAYRNIAYERERRIVRRMRSPVQKAFSLAHGFIAGHGYLPGRGVVLSLFIILVGWAVYSSASILGMLTEFVQLSGPAVEASAGFKPLLYSADLFLPVVNLHEAERWRLSDSMVASDAANEAHKWFASLIFAFAKLQILAGWLVSALTGLAFSGVLRKE